MSAKGAEVRQTQTPVKNRANRQDDGDRVAYERRHKRGVNWGFFNFLNPNPPEERYEMATTDAEMARTNRQYLQTVDRALLSNYQNRLNESYHIRAEHERMKSGVILFGLTLVVYGILATIRPGKYLVEDSPVAAACADLVLAALIIFVLRETRQDIKELTCFRQPSANYNTMFNRANPRLPHSQSDPLIEEICEEEGEERRTSRNLGVD